MSKPLVYIAGPYASPDPILNTHNTIHLADKLASDNRVTPLVPHLSLLWHLVSPHPAEFWYAYDLELMLYCDALLRLPGESSGADREERKAHEAFMPVFYTIAELYAWADEISLTNF